MGLTYLLWICLFAYVIHICEEGLFGWKKWVRKAGLIKSPTWFDFTIINVAVIILGAVCALVGWRVPFLALTFPALMIINALFSHILPTLFMRCYSPGLVTAVLLFLPIALVTFWAAYLVGYLTWGVSWLAFLCAAILMLLLFSFFKLKSKFQN